MAAIGRLSWLLAGALLAALALVAAPPAEGAGLWNLPTNLRQCLGIGFGPGYHAPFVTQVPVLSKTATQPTIYTLHPPRASGCPSGFCEGMSSLGGYAPVAYETHVHGPHVHGAPVGYGAPGVSPNPAPVFYGAPTPTLAPSQSPISAEPVARPPGEPASPSDFGGVPAGQPRPEPIPLP